MALRSAGTALALTRLLAIAIASTAALASCASQPAKPLAGPASPVARASDDKAASDRTKPAAAPDDTPPDPLFLTAKALYDGKEYQSAIPAFAEYRKAARKEHERVTDEWTKAEEARADKTRPGAPAPKMPARVAEALYLEGIAEWEAGEKKRAHDLFREILVDHRSFSEIADVVRRDYEIGLAFIEGKAERPVPVLSFLHMTSEALGAEILEFLLANYQQKYFDYAQFEVGEYYFRRREFRRAADSFSAVEESFRDSPWAGAAQVRRALCYLRQGRGFRYDPVPADRAEEVLLDYVRKNPSGSRIQEADAALREIRDGRAALYVENARYYGFREGKPRAALVYVEAIVREAPDSPAAAAVPDLLEDVIARSENKDPACADQARDALADYQRRKEAGASGAPPSSPAPPTLVPGGARGKSR